MAMEDEWQNQDYDNWKYEESQECEDDVARGRLKCKVCRGSGGTWGSPCSNCGGSGYHDLVKPGTKTEPSKYKWVTCSSCSGGGKHHLIFKCKSCGGSGGHHELKEKKKE